MNAIGIDIGGTKIDLILMTPGGNILHEMRLPTLPEQGAVAAMDRIAAGIKHLLGQTSQPVVGVGIGSPGYIDADAGVIGLAVNLGWNDVPVVSLLRERLNHNLTLWLQNDVNNAALGERFLGSARGATSFVYLAVGTGLGGAAMIGDKLITGVGNGAMEIGHLELMPSRRPCTCGLHGCAEIYVSGVGLLAGLREHAPKYPHSDLLKHPEPTTHMILESARAGDPLAVAVMTEAAEALGRVITACAAVLNPELVVLGGGLGAAAQDLLIEPALQTFQRYALAPAVSKSRIENSCLDRIALGAGCLAFLNAG
ncbi:MAG: ROK family protein, partial [Phototrophicaceae bacterium]